MLLPTLSACHNLRLPPTEKDDRYNLHVRTGSASTLYNSFIFAYGGLTIGLDIAAINQSEILTSFNANCANKKSSKLADYLSGEVFVLNLIEKNWIRVDVDEKPCARMFHEILAMNNKLYVYGGLTVDPKDETKLIALQDLWVLDLETKKWQCLAELSGTGGRYCHKMTSISSIPGNSDHFGLMIAGGRTIDNKNNLTNVIYDLVEEMWLPPRHLLDEHNQPIHIDYVKSLLVSVKTNNKLSILSYTHDDRMLHSFKVGSSISAGRPLSINTNISNVVPSNLRYPVAGLFGQNIILTGFLLNDYDISIFVFNSPTGKWSRLNVFCNHDYGSHRFWGGFTWQSHHRVVLLGNYVTSRTTSAIRYFTCLITVNLPVTNILASSEMAGTSQSSDEKLESETESSHVESESRRPSSSSTRAISFTDYVHYAAPTTNVTTIRSVFPPAAVTLGRNFLDRFGDLVLDFELISVNGDRVPVSMMLLLERWGPYFVELLARGYISTVEQFDQSQKTKPTIALEEYTEREAPHFRLPFQDKETSKSVEDTPDPKSDTNSTNDVELLSSNLQDLPPQLPLPSEQTPPVPNPVSFRSSSRKNSTDLASPRGSLIHTLTQLRNIPVKSPKSSPLASPRASVVDNSIMNQGLGIDMSESPIPSLKPEEGKPEPEPKKQPSTFETLLNFDTLEDGTFNLESSLIPRKLYIPFATTSVKSFCEYFYTGQIGNKWLLSPTTLDNLLLAKHCQVPLLYDLICEVLYGIIGRRESWIISKSRDLKQEYVRKMELYGEEIDLECPLDEYEGLIETVDDGYLDLALLSRTAQSLVSSSSKKDKRGSADKKNVNEGEDENENEDEDEDTTDNLEDTESQESRSSRSSISSGPSATSGTSSSSHPYLESHDLPSMGPESKSIFDKKNAGHSEKSNEFTLEQLVSVELAIPDLEVIELISHTVTMTADLKLMLRVNNVKQMSELLEEYEAKTKEKLESLEFKVPKIKPTLDIPEQAPEDITIATPQATTPNKMMTEPFDPVPFPVAEHPSILRSATSSISLSGISTPPGATLERERTNSSLRTGLVSLTPFKPIKDKDEKEDDNSSILSTKKKHGLFHLLGHSKSKDQLVEKKRLFGKKK